MRRYTFLIVVSGGCTLSSFAQLKECLQLKNDSRFEKVELSLNVKAGALNVRSTHTPDIVKVYGGADVQVDNRVVGSKIEKKTYFIHLLLGRQARMGVGQNISERFFGTRGHLMDNLWSVLLTEAKPYSLNIICGLGDTNIDMSDLLIKRLKVRTGSADITVFYGSDVGNKVIMDTLLLQADVGFIHARQLNLARPKTIIAEVGFGNILLDFGGVSPSQGIHVISSVGTGSLVVILPESGVPVKVHISNSWFYDLDTHWSLQQISKNTFANRAYLTKQPDPLTFDIDVSMGSVTFR